MSLTILGQYIIKQGGRKVVTKRNHLTDYMVCSWLYCLNDWAPGWYTYIRNAGSYFVIGFGKDMVTKTTPNMSLLADIVSYKPDSRSYGGFTKEDDGTYISKYVCTWNANHFSSNQTLGEVALHLNANPPDTDGGTPGTANKGETPIQYWDGTKMHSRASVADGDFQPFTVDYTLPLTIEYWIRLTYV